MLRRAPILMTLLFACETAPDVSQTAADLTIDQNSGDVTVLAASAKSPIGGQGVKGFDPIDCTAIDDIRMDCTDAFEQRMGAPALHRIVVPVQQTGFFCKVLEVTTVSRSKAAQVSDGIGFFYDGYSAQTGFHFTPASDLVVVAHGVLAQGGAATQHRFVGLANCWLGSGSSSFFAEYRFKPFMQFTAADTGFVYRNWDAANDYLISPQVTSFNRSFELLH